VREYAAANVGGGADRGSRDSRRLRRDQKLIGTPTNWVALPSWNGWNGSPVGTAFLVAVIGLALVASVAWAVTTPFAAGDELYESERRAVAVVAFGQWTALA